MAEEKKKKKDSQPKVPEAQSFDTGSLMKAWEDFYKPQSSGDYMKMYDEMLARFPNDYTMTNNIVMENQRLWAPEMRRLQELSQTGLFNNMSRLQRENAPQNAATQNQMLQQYAPQFRQAYDQQYGGIGELGKVATQGLSDGYNLGEGLSKEIEQGIRGAQMARGNWAGSAPTAQEAFGKGQASIDLYNQRLGQYNQYLGQQQNFLQGNNPIAMMGQTGAATGMGNQYYPNPVVDTNLGAGMFQNMGQQAGNVFSSIGNQQGNYNSALGSAMGQYNGAQLQANDQNNNWMFQQYDRNADAWMYRESVRNGLYSTPQVGGGGGGMGGMGGMMGQVGGAVGTGMMGLAASGIIGGGATAAGVGIAGAAAGAAAALCWLARKLIPDKWKSYRKWLFTHATTEERQDYIFNARRIANAIP